MDHSKISQFIRTTGWSSGKNKAKSLPYSLHPNQFQMHQKFKQGNYEHLRENGTLKNNLKSGKDLSQ